MSYNVAIPEKVKIGGPTRTEGDIEKVYSSDEDEKNILLAILKELKKMNMYLSLLTDVNIKNNDVEV